MALKTPEYLQTKTYSAVRDRLVLQHGGQIQAGVWDANDFKVVQRAAGANMQVDIGAGFALVPANDPGNQGLYHVENDAAVLGAVTFSAAHATLPRIDQVYVQVDDTTSGGDVDDIPQFGIATGTPTSGATLDNRTGAVSTLPTGALRLADVLVGAGVTSITNANIRDRRPWARGAHYSAVETAGDYSATTTWTIFTAQIRLECTGLPLEIWASGEAQASGAAAGSWTGVLPFIDGAIPAEIGTTATAPILQFGGTYNDGAAGSIRNFMGRVVLTPAAGSHVFGIASASSPAAGIIRRAANKPFRWGVRELPLPNASNT